MTPFAILGLSDTASTEEAKSRFRKLAQIYHPDRNDDPTAEERFKEIKAAWELIANGWRPSKQEEMPREHPPKHVYKYDASTYNTAYTVHATFEDTFIQRPVDVPGTCFKVIPPYGILPGSTIEQQAIPPNSHQRLFITWNIYDPTGFYHLKKISDESTDRLMLCCTLKVTVAQVLAEEEILIPNINPQLSKVKVQLDPTKAWTVGYVKLPHTGLQRVSGSGRDSLYVYLSFNYDSLEREHYHTLIRLREKINLALVNHKSALS